MIDIKNLAEKKKVTIPLVDYGINAPYDPVLLIEIDPSYGYTPLKIGALRYRREKRLMDFYFDTSGRYTPFEGGFTGHWVIEMINGDWVIYADDDKYQKKILISKIQIKAISKIIEDFKNKVEKWD